jgi:hypothetical protein
VCKITNKEKKYPAALLALELYPDALNEINEKDTEEFDRGFSAKEKMVNKTQGRFLELHSITFLLAN